MFANIGEIDEGAFAQLPLHTEMPGLHITSSNILGDVPGLRQSRAESGRADEVWAVTLRVGTEAGGRLRVAAQIGVLW